MGALVRSLGKAYMLSESDFQLVKAVIDEVRARVVESAEIGLYGSPRWREVRARLLKHLGSSPTGLEGKLRAILLSNEIGGQQ